MKKILTGLCVAMAVVSFVSIASAYNLTIKNTSSKDSTMKINNSYCTADHDVVPGVTPKKTGSNTYSGLQVIGVCAAAGVAPGQKCTAEFYESNECDDSAKAGSGDIDLATGAIENIQNTSSDVQAAYDAGSQTLTVSDITHNK